MFSCENCGKEIQYDFVFKCWTCESCGFTKAIQPKIKSCPHCGQEYTEWTWFDPKRCSCGYSLVE